LRARDEEDISVSSSDVETNVHDELAVGQGHLR